VVFQLVSNHGCQFIENQIGQCSDNTDNHQRDYPFPLFYPIGMSTIKSWKAHSTAQNCCQSFYSKHSTSYTADIYKYPGFFADQFCFVMLAFIIRFQAVDYSKKRRAENHSQSCGHTCFNQRSHFFSFVPELVSYQTAKPGYYAGKTRFRSQCPAEYQRKQGRYRQDVKLVIRIAAVFVDLSQDHRQLIGKRPVFFLPQTCQASSN